MTGTEMLYALDLFGTLVFAVTGAFRAVKYELDILGVLVLSVFTGVGGGMLRDVVLGVFPPAVFTNETYLLVCLGGGLLVFFTAPYIARWWNLVKVFDAVGLGVFAALGALKGYDHGLGPIGVVMMGTMTAVGGGVIRDILVSEIPAVLSSDFYATAAALGALSLWGAKALGWGNEVSLVVCAALTIGLRLLAMQFQFGLPRVRNLPAPPGELAKRFVIPWKKRVHRRAAKNAKSTKKGN
jgi:uncharacterized membrane protein YeiH